MRRKVLFILLAGILCFAAVPASAQDEPAGGRPAPYSSTIKSSLWGPRFELLTIEGVAAPSLFKIDKHTGDVWMLSGSIGASNKLTKIFRETDIDDDVVEVYMATPGELLWDDINADVMWKIHADLERQLKN